MAKAEPDRSIGCSVLPLPRYRQGVGQQALLNTSGRLITNRCRQASLATSWTGLTPKDKQRNAQPRLGDWGNSAGFTSMV